MIIISLPVTVKFVAFKGMLGVPCTKKNDKIMLGNNLYPCTFLGYARVWIGTREDL